METQIKVLLVDDHNLVTEAWTALLSQTPGLLVLGSTDNAESAVAMCLEHRPDVVLMDINLNGCSGLDATEKICNILPKTKVIGLSLHDNVSIVKRIISLGALGYVSKNATKRELVEAIKCVHAGEKYIAESIKNKFFSDMVFKEVDESNKELTFKEIEIVKLIADGLTSKDIATKIFISPRTVDTHRHNILKKLKLQNAAQLSSWARENGLI